MPIHNYTQFQITIKFQETKSVCMGIVFIQASTRDEFTFDWRKQFARKSYNSVRKKNTTSTYVASWVLNVPPCRVHGFVTLRPSTLVVVIKTHGHLKLLNTTYVLHVSLKTAKKGFEGRISVHLFDLCRLQRPYFLPFDLATSGRRHTRMSNSNRVIIAFAVWCTYNNKSWTIRIKNSLWKYTGSYATDIPLSPTLASGCKTITF